MKEKTRKEIQHWLTHQVYDLSDIRKGIELLLKVYLEKEEL